MHENPYHRIPAVELDHEVDAMKTNGSEDQAASRVTFFGQSLWVAEGDYSPEAKEQYLDKLRKWRQELEESIISISPSILRNRCTVHLLTCHHRPTKGGATPSHLPPALLALVDPDHLAHSGGRLPLPSTTCSYGVTFDLGDPTPSLMNFLVRKKSAPRISDSARSLKPGHRGPLGG